MQAAICRQRMILASKHDQTVATSDGIGFKD
jgi:hypothetical protein